MNGRSAASASLVQQREGLKMATSVMVLMGGWSSEREISLVSGRHITKALISAGYDVRTHNLQRDIPALMAALTPPA